MEQLRVCWMTSFCRRVQVISKYKSVVKFTQSTAKPIAMFCTDFSILIARLWVMTPNVDYSFTLFYCDSDNGQKLIQPHLGAAIWSCQLRTIAEVMEESTAVYATAFALYVVLFASTKQLIKSNVASNTYLLLRLDNVQSGTQITCQRCFLSVKSDSVLLYDADLSGPGSSYTIGPQPSNLPFPITLATITTLVPRLQLRLRVSQSRAIPTSSV